MAQKKLDNSRIILPLVAAVLVLASLIQAGLVPALGWVAFPPAALFVIGYLFVKQTGWRELARKYPASPPLRGPWNTCPTAVMATVELGGAEYERRKVRLNFIVRVGVDDQALYVSAMWFFAPLLPPIRLPWSAIARVRYFDPSGWYKYTPNPGMVFQLNYDPGYAGQFAEIQIAEPTAFLQLPAGLLSEAIAHFPA
jgi:hypothetical protein